MRSSSNYSTKLGFPYSDLSYPSGSLMRWRQGIVAGRSWLSKGVDCIERESGRDYTRIQAYLAETVSECANEGSATLLEIAYGVVIVLPARGMNALIGR
eukprot:IDg6934t1